MNVYFILEFYSVTLLSFLLNSADFYFFYSADLWQINENNYILG